MNDGFEGRSLGLVGGLGVGATIHYYQELVKAHSALGCVPNLVMVHADVNRILGYAAARETTQMAGYLSHLIRRLSDAGAEIAVVPSITPHMCASELSQLSVLPLVDLIVEIVREVHARRFRRVALFGTRFTIETKMFGKLVGLDVVMPHAEEIDAIHETYVQLVSAGRGTEEQYQRLRGIAHTLCERDGVEAIILGGTELSLLFNPANTDFPHIDGARLHLEAIMRELFRGAAGWRT
jgi:aspartate racemase